MGDEKRLKLSDLGLARSLAYTGVYLKTSEGKLPIRWMALESITDRTFTHHSDVLVSMWPLLFIYLILLCHCIGGPMELRFGKSAHWVSS